MTAPSALRTTRGRLRRQRELAHARDMRRVRAMNTLFFLRTVKSLELLNRLTGPGRDA